MRSNKYSNLIVSGSLAYDQIMDFSGLFSNHILPEAIHKLNLSFILNNLRTSFGGTAGNIAYNLTLFKEKPIVLGIVGSDFVPYAQWLEKHGVNLHYLAKVAKVHSAAAYIITDHNDNQIAAFYPGPTRLNYGRTVALKFKKNDLAIIAPEDKNRMLEYAAIYQQKKLDYIFDPGQALGAFSASELKKAIPGAKILIGNDYEIEVILNKLKIDQAALRRMVDILVITRGARGSEIYQGTKKILVKAARPKNTSDPTGAGDAYRAGFIKGFILDFDLKICGQIASLAAVYTVEKFGTQTHKFTLGAFRKRYQENFGEILKI
ncbi:MAG: carbohydrate kinase family protein [Patescibacteria group bacterium]